MQTQPHTEGQKHNETLYLNPPIEESQELAKEMMDTLNESIAIAKELKALGIRTAKGENIYSLEAAHKILAEFNSFHQLRTSTHPLAKKLLAVCDRYPTLKGIFGEAFTIFELNLLRRIQAKKAANQIN